MIKIANKHSREIQQTIGLTSSMVGVKLLFNGEDTVNGIERLEAHRYCQALMKARQGQHAILDGNGISCPAAAAAFGFKPLPEGLKSGKGLVGFGIVNNEHTGKIMFENMTTLKPGELKAIYLFPLETADIEPDIVVVEDETEKLMWIALAYLNATKGRRIESNTAILQATCVDATLIPFLQQKLNMSMGCYGCRNATDIGANETVIGFPYKFLKPIAENIKFLGQKAIPDSRGKSSFEKMNRKGAEKKNKTTLPTPVKINQ